ncbi:MAG TPA: proline dehydrogenase family protein [Candidatus Saccharimonadales bacterium]|nr:proline dehydrogenase family protein [Candidatus Saccharimonadales bacterium]
MTSEAWGSQPSSSPPGASASAALRHVLLWASRRRQIKRAVTSAPVTRDVVRRFVAGETIEEALAVTRTLTGEGLRVSLDHLGEDTLDTMTARAAVDAYRSLAGRLADEGLAAAAEMSVKLSAVGQALDESLALDNARLICEAAHSAGSSVTIDMEDHSTTDSTLRVVGLLRQDFPSTGAVLQASLRRTEEDSRILGVPGSRVRLCKGAYQEPSSLAWQRPEDIRGAYLRCLSTLIAGGALPMAATHDPKLVAATARLVGDIGGPGFRHEYQMLFGIRPDEQRRLVRAGETVRVYVPFGVQWYGYLMRRMAERPANTALFLRALMSRN